MSKMEHKQNENIFLMFVATIQIVIVTMINVNYCSLGKFTIGYFHVKIVCGKIFSSLGISNEIFLTMKYFKVKLFVPLLKSLMHNYVYITMHTCILHKHRHITTIAYNFERDFYRGTSTRALHIEASY